MYWAELYRSQGNTGNEPWTNWCKCKQHGCVASVFSYILQHNHTSYRCGGWYVPAASEMWSRGEGQSEERGRAQSKSLAGAMLYVFPASRSSMTYIQITPTRTTELNDHTLLSSAPLSLVVKGARPIRTIDPVSQYPVYLVRQFDTVDRTVSKKVTTEW